jgi:hypothetical protein
MPPKPMRPTPWQKLVPFALALAVYLGAYAVMRPTPTGDEPHYLLAAESLAFDGDLGAAVDVHESLDEGLRPVGDLPVATME